MTAARNAIWAGASAVRRRGGMSADGGGMCELGVEGRVMDSRPSGVRGLNSGVRGSERERGGGEGRVGKTHREMCASRGGLMWKMRKTGRDGSRLPWAERVWWVEGTGDERAVETGERRKSQATVSVNKGDLG